MAFAGYDAWKTTDPRDRDRPEPPMKYRCVGCARILLGGAAAYAHHRETAHPVRGRDWPASWPDARFATHAPPVSDPTPSLAFQESPTPAAIPSRRVGSETGGVPAQEQNL
jgi:hypothetical protein